MEKNSPAPSEESLAADSVEEIAIDATDADDATEAAESARPVEPARSDDDSELDNAVIALLFAADEPLSVRKISAVIETSEASDIKKSIDRWRTRFEDEAWSIRIEMVGGGYQISTHADYSTYIARLYTGKRKFRLSRAGLEVLAIIAYKQPVTRAEIESIRGVGSGGVVANLMERSLIKIVGKAKVLGAPFLYGSTPEFLSYLGLSSIKDLPSMEELEALLEKEAYPEAALESDSVVEALFDGDEAQDEADDNEDAPVVSEEVPHEPVAASAKLGAFSNRARNDESEAEYDADTPSHEEDDDAHATSAPAKSPDDAS